MNKQERGTPNLLKWLKILRSRSTWTTCGFTVPASAAYKVMSTIDDRFKPKHRRTRTETFVEVEPIVAPAADVADDEDVPEIKTN